MRTSRVDSTLALCAPPPGVVSLTTPGGVAHVVFDSALATIAHVLAMAAPAVALARSVARLTTPSFRACFPCNCFTHRRRIP